MRILILFSLALSLAATVPVLAEPEPQTVSPDPRETSVIEPIAAEPTAAQHDPVVRFVSPLQSDIRAVIDEETVRIAELRLSIERATDEAEILRLQREVEACKLSAELRILELQAAHARAAGRVETAVAIEAAVARLRNPEPPTRPTGHPRVPDKQGR